VARYEATDGREGGTLEGRPVVILTMTGATSGKIRKTPIMRVERDGTYVAVASAGGAPNHPACTPQSCSPTPTCASSDGARLHRLRAREVFGEEKGQAWKLADSRWPHFPEYRATADATSRSCSWNPPRQANREPNYRMAVLTVPVAGSVR